MDNTIEQKTAQTVLQQPTQVVVGDRTYDVAPPTLKTLILASAAISQLPQEELDHDHIVQETLYIAKNCAILGDVAAILILGAKGLKETATRPRKGLLGLLGFKREVVIDRQAELADYILANLAPKAIREVIMTLVQKLQLGDFFGLTTFLIDLNLLRPTKVEETTAFGQ